MLEPSSLSRQAHSRLLSFSGQLITFLCEAFHRVSVVQIVEQASVCGMIRDRRNEL